MLDDPSSHSLHAGMETSVRYRTSGPVVRVTATIFIGAATIAFIWMAFFMARQVVVDCNRDLGTCVITRTYPLFGAQRSYLALADLRGTGLRSRRTKNGAMTYAVTLRTQTGEEVVSASYAIRGRMAQKRALDAFLANPEAPPLHLVYDEGSPFGLLLGLFALVNLWVLWTTWQEATVRFERWRQAVVLERRRWPLPLWTRAFPAREVTGARVQDRGWRGRNSKLRMVLTLDSGEEVPLLGPWGGGRGYHDDIEASLNAEINRS